MANVNLDLILLYFETINLLLIQLPQIPINETGVTTCTRVSHIFEGLLLCLCLMIPKSHKSVQLLHNRLVATARKCIGQNASLEQVYGSMQEAYQQMQSPLIYQEPSSQVYGLDIRESFGIILYKTL